MPGATIRHGDWKLLVKGRKPSEGESDQVGKKDRIPAHAGTLFNLSSDLGETTDVAAEHPDKVAELTKIMSDFMSELDAHSRPIGNLSNNSK